MSNKNVMVCVTDQKVCEKLIFNGLEILESSPGEMHVLHVSKGDVLNDEKSSNALEYLFEICNKYDASMTVLKSDNILNTLHSFATKNSIDVIIMGESRNADPKTSVICDLENMLKEKIDINVVSTK